MENKAEALDQNDFTGIGCVDWENIRHVMDALESNEIVYLCHGSRIAGIHVIPSDVERAKEILKQDASINNYMLYLGE